MNIGKSGKNCFLREIIAVNKHQLYDNTQHEHSLHMGSGQCKKYLKVWKYIYILSKKRAEVCALWQMNLYDLSTLSDVETKLPIWRWSAHIRMRFPLWF